MARKDPSEFSPAVVAKLAQRAGQVCSNPHCQRATSGGHSNKDKSVVIGEAAHIRGQRPGSARYDSSMALEAIGDISNGIWLCGGCHKMVDTDEVKFPVWLLMKWKDEHESGVLEAKKPQKASAVENKPILDLHDSIGYTGGPPGYFHTFTVINRSDKDALECRFRLEGFNYLWVPDLEPRSGISIEPRGKKEITYQIPSFHEDNVQPPVRDLQFVMEYKNTDGLSFISKRDIDQTLKNIIYMLSIGRFHSPTVKEPSSVSIRFRELLPYNGVVTGLFEVNNGSPESIMVEIGISGTLLATWGFENNRELAEAAIKQVGHKKIENMARTGSFDNHIFQTYDFSNDYQNGYEGYKKFIASLD